MSIVLKVTRDFFGLIRIAGILAALVWASKILLNLREILRTGNLQPADQAMGDGPFKVRHKGRTALLSTRGAFGSIREIWVRDVYGFNDLVKIPENGIVVDLGANIGCVSILAMVSCPTAKVVALEGDMEILPKLEANVKLNDYGGNIKVCSGFIGKVTEVQADILTREPSKSVPILSEVEFLSRYGITQIDLLKCDIEGSEFDFLALDSKILDISRTLVVELHKWGGDMAEFVDTLKSKGFHILRIDWEDISCTLVAQK